MPNASIGSAATYAALAALIAWRVYARFRRMVGRQRLSSIRAGITLALFPALLVLIALPSLDRPLNLAGLTLMLAVGAALGRFGLTHTRFEAVPGVGLFYTPNAPLGITLSLVFVARIAWRLVEVFLLAPELPRTAGEFAQSPLTLLAFGLLAGYYIRYAIGLLQWRARVLAAKRAREAVRETSPAQLTADSTAKDTADEAPQSIPSDDTRKLP